MSARPEIESTANRHAQRREAKRMQNPNFGCDSERDAFSIAEFCRRHSISVPMFYKLQSQGKAPTTFSVGVRRLISREAAAAWRREQEEAAAV